MNEDNQFNIKIPNKTGEILLLTFTEDDNSISDLTGYSFILKVRRTPNEIELITLTSDIDGGIVVDTNAGTVSIEVLREHSEIMGNDFNGFYDLVSMPQGEMPERIMWGGWYQPSIISL